MNMRFWEGMDWWKDDKRKFVVGVKRTGTSETVLRVGWEDRYCDAVLNVTDARELAKKLLSLSDDADGVQHQKSLHQDILARGVALPVRGNE